MMSNRTNQDQMLDNEIQKSAIDDLVILIHIYVLDAYGSVERNPAYTLTPSTTKDLDDLDPSTVRTAEPIRFLHTSGASKITRNYTPFPIEISEVENSASSSMPRPIMTLSNLSNVLNLDPESIVGGRVEIIHTFKKYLFGEAQGNAGSSLPVQSFVIDRLAAETFEFLSYELASPYDLEEVKLPTRRIVGGQCPWKYKGASIDTVQGFTDAAITQQEESTTTSAMRGGCDFPRDNKVWTGNRYSAVNMTANDEYIVDSRSVTLDYNSIPDDDLIAENTYVYTYSSDYEIDEYGIQKAVKTTLKLYWQCTQTMSLATDREAPSETSGKWRQVRVFSPYDKSATYKGFSDKRNNEYISYLSIGQKGGAIELQFKDDSYILRTLYGPVEATLVNPTASGHVHFIELDQEVYNNILAGINYFVKFSNLVLEGSSLSAEIENATYSSPRLISAKSHLAQLNLGLDEGEVSLFELGGVAYLLVGMGDLDGSSVNFDGMKLWVYEEGSGPIEQVYRVKDRTVNPSLLSEEFHRPLNFAAIYSQGASPYWIRGDVCSKTLSACVLRFGASEVTNTQLGEDEGNNFTYAFRVSNTDSQAYFRTPETDYRDDEPDGLIMANKDAFRVSQEVYDSVGDEGYAEVEVFINGEYVNSFPDCAKTSSAAAQIAVSENKLVYFPGENYMFSTRSGGSNLSDLSSVPARFGWSSILLYFAKMENTGGVGMADVSATHTGPFTPSGRTPYWTLASVYGLEETTFTNGATIGSDVDDEFPGNAVSRWSRDSRLAERGMFYYGVTTPELINTVNEFGYLATPGMYNIPRATFGLGYGLQTPQLFGPSGLILNGAQDEDGNSIRIRYSASSNPANTGSSTVVRSNVALPFGGFPGSRRFK